LPLKSSLPKLPLSHSKAASVLVTLGVTGCIAAYKAVEVMRGLQERGVSVHVILTRAAEKFVGPLTFEALSGRPVIIDLFRRDLNTGILHIRAAQEADLLAVVPATADILGKFAAGIADDALSTVYLSCPHPVVLAPAMNVEMWNHPAVRRNVAILRERGHSIVDPEAGMLACGTEGEGRLADVAVIVERILSLAPIERTLAGATVLVTAGPTVEDIDPVRFISNRSSGKMGYAAAAAARRVGAVVRLVTGPTGLTPPAGVEVIPVRSAAEMREAVLSRYPESDVVIMAAAVADYSPAQVSLSKLKKSDPELNLRLVRNEDILATLGSRKTNQVLVGFAAETSDAVANATDKLRRKRLDLIVANDVSAGVFGEDSATVHLVRAHAEPETLDKMSKFAIAQRLLEIVSDLLRQRASVRS